MSGFLVYAAAVVIYPDDAGYLGESRARKFARAPLNFSLLLCALKAGPSSTFTNKQGRTPESTQPLRSLPHQTGKSSRGYYTLSQYAIQLDSIPKEEAKKLPKYPMFSTILLGRLAVSTNFLGQRVGEAFPTDALRRS